MTIIINGQSTLTKEEEQELRYYEDRCKKFRPSIGTVVYVGSYDNVYTVVATGCFGIGVISGVNDITESVHLDEYENEFWDKQAVGFEPEYVLKDKWCWYQDSPWSQDQYIGSEYSLGFEHDINNP